jgi:hypothetical protein
MAAAAAFAIAATAHVDSIRGVWFRLGACDPDDYLAPLKNANALNEIALDETGSRGIHAAAQGLLERGKGISGGVGHGVTSVRASRP